MNALKDIYINKGSKNNIQPNIIRITGKELSKGVDAGYGVLQGVDFDSPDYAMREYLKRNVWKFSVAKNYNDSIRLSNLLVRKDGSLRPWNEFKREALMVVGESNRYLKTEYNTVVSGAQMSRMWQEIQRDKHIFPFVQFDVVMDGRTSDICSPLDKLIFEVDDPVLAYYFPPNHFNCRTRVRKLRNGVPSKNYTLPDIPTEFKNNVGMCPPAYKKLLSNDNDKKPIRKECGEIFTEENRYIKNTPTKLLSDLDYYRDENILVSSKAKKYTKSEIERPRVENEYKNRILVAKSLQRLFKLKTTVLPEIKPSHWAYDYHFEGVKEYGKVPDFKIGGDFWGNGKL